MLCPHFVLFPGGGSDPDKVEDDAEDSGGEEKGEGEEDMEDYLNDPDFQNMSDSEGDDLPLFEVCPDHCYGYQPHRTRMFLYCPNPFRLFFCFITGPGTVLLLTLALFLL
jgi:hypothetical protein